MDIALILDHLVPHAQYGGCLTANTQEEFDALRWEDDRPKPSWDVIVANAGYTPPLSLVDQLKSDFTQLSPDQQGAFGPLAAAVFLYLSQDNPAAAKAVIEQASVPSELEPLRQAMLAKFA